VGLSAGFMITLVAAALTPPFTAESPERMSIVLLRDADPKRSRWLVYAESSRLSPQMAQQGSFGSRAVVPYPWPGRFRALAAEAPDLPLLAPLVSVREDSRFGSARRVRLHIASQRKAPAVFLAIPPSVPIRAVRVAGVPLPTINSRVLAWRGGWHVVSCLTTPVEGIDFDFETAAGPSLEISVGDRSAGLPPEGAGLLQARGRLAAPSDEGDTTVVTRRLKL